MKKTYLFLLIFVFVSPAWGNTYQNVQVKRIVDGDTVDIAVEIWPRLAQAARIRIDGIDTPELKSRSQCERVLAKQAKYFVEGFLEGGKTYELYTVGKLDAFGRAMGDIAVDGEWLSMALEKAGHTRPWVPNNKAPWCVD